MTRGVIRGGEFFACSDGGRGRGVPECFGRAACTCQGPECRSCGCCTCPSFSAAELTFAREHGLTLERDDDLPSEWQAHRGLGGPRSWVVADDWCRFCRTTQRVVGGPAASICETCARSVLSIMATSDDEGWEGRRLGAVRPGSASP